MEQPNIQPGPIVDHAEPVFCVKDINETVNYWHEVLGFPGKWTWGDPPNHGGVSWHGAFIQFSLNPELAEKAKGTWIWIRVTRLELLFEEHQKRNVNIVKPIQDQPWGMSDYVVMDNNGYYIVFSAPLVYKGSEKEKEKASIRLVERKPTSEEYLTLMKSVGWVGSPEEELQVNVEDRLNSVLFAVMAEEPSTGEAIGCALIIGDDVSYYYIKDVMVRPDYQHQGVGTAVMQVISNWLDKNGKDKSLVSLICGESLEKFYKQFGFAKAYSMIKHIQRKG